MTKLSVLVVFYQFILGDLGSTELGSYLFLKLTNWIVLVEGS